MTTTTDTISIMDDSHEITSVFAVGALTIFTSPQEVPMLGDPMADGLQVLSETSSEPSLCAAEAGSTILGGVAGVRFPLTENFAIVPEFTGYALVGDGAAFVWTGGIAFAFAL